MMYVAIFACREPWNTWALGVFESEPAARGHIEGYVADLYEADFSWDEGYYCSNDADFGFLISEIES